MGYTMRHFKLWFSCGFDHAGWFGHGFINCLRLDRLLCFFYKKLIIWEKMPLFFAKQIICDLISSCIVIEQFNPSAHVENLLDEI